MLQANALTLTHTKDSRVLIRDLSFTINDRQKTVIIGEEGNGKVPFCGCCTIRLWWKAILKSPEPYGKTVCEADI